MQGALSKTRHSCADDFSVSDKDLLSGALDELMKDIDCGSGSCL